MARPAQRPSTGCPSVSGRPFAGPSPLGPRVCAIPRLVHASEQYDPGSRARLRRAALHLGSPSVVLAPPGIVHSDAAVTRAVGAAPPTVAETKQAFLSAFSKPLPPGLGGVVQDLLVQQHFVRWGATGCPADPIALLGLRSVLEQVLAGVPGAVEIQHAFLLALQMNPEAIGSTVQSLEEAALRRPALEALMDPEYQGPSLFLSNALRAAKAEMEAGRPFYNRFFAVGLFRVLGLAGSATPQALDELCALCAAPVKRVHADLLSYKMMLSKLHPRSRPATARTDNAQEALSGDELGSGEPMQPAESISLTAQSRS